MVPNEWNRKNRSQCGNEEEESLETRPSLPCRDGRDGQGAGVTASEVRSAALLNREREVCVGRQALGRQRKSSPSPSLPVPTPGPIPTAFL